LILAAGAIGFWGGQQGGSGSEAIAEVDRKLTVLAEAIGAELGAAKPVELELAGSPVRGPVDAPVTIVEFSDFQCPYCLKAHPTLTRLLEEYPEKVKLVFKHFPLSFHKEAVNAHRAVVAAGEQGKFWQMHDLILSEVKDLSTQKMMAHAATLGLEREAFETVFNSDKAQGLIDRDMEQGRQVGVRGTPAFFINGQYMAGAQPYTVFKQAVDAALSES